MASDTDERSRSATLIALLIDDVIAARNRLAGADSQTARRDVVRASLAAMEGYVWEVRQHIASTLAELEELTPMADLALREISYLVTTDGKIVEQPRWLPLPTAIRLVVSQAMLVSPEIQVDFSEAGWSYLRQAVTVRNRITHPKLIDDLTITDGDLKAVASGLSWVVATGNYVMASTNLAFVRYNVAFRDMLDRLKAGDPDALAAYQAALAEPS
jgi:hypothetical protein